MKCVLFVLLAAVMLLSGCDSTEIGSRAIIQAAAVDYYEEEYTVSVLMFSSGGSDEINASEENVIKVTGRGKTFVEALNDISLIDGKEIYFSETKLLIIGGGFSEKSFVPLLEVLTQELRCSLDMLICCAEDPELLTDLHFTEGLTAAEKPVSMIENAYRSGNSPRTRLLDLLNGAASGQSVLLPYFVYTENGFGMTPDDEGATAVLNGSRAFTNGRLGRRRDSTETGGAMLLSGDSDHIMLTFSHAGKELSCEAYCVRIKQLPDGNLSVSAKLRRRSGEKLPDELKDAAMDKLNDIISSALVA